MMKHSNNNYKITLDCLTTFNIDLAEPFRTFQLLIPLSFDLTKTYTLLEIVSFMSAMFKYKIVLTVSSY